MSNLDRSPAVVCLSGGRAGAAFVDQLARHVPAERLTILLNTGNDDLRGANRDMPDVDLHLSVLADDPVAIAKIPAARNRLLDSGHTLTAAVRTLGTQFNIGPTLLPISDLEMTTQVVLGGEERPLPAWVGLDLPADAAAAALQYPDSARATRSVLQALNVADIILLAPANPHLYLLPMINAYPVRATLEDHPTAVVIGVYPPAIPAWESRFLNALNLPPSLSAYWHLLDNLLDGCLYPDTLEQLPPPPEDLTLQATPSTAANLAENAYRLGLSLLN